MNCLPRWLPPVLSLASALLLLPADATAVQPKQDKDSLDYLAFSSERLAAPAVLEPVDQAATELEPGVRQGWQSFRAAEAGEWRGQVDRRHGRIDSAEGRGIPFLPGRGNGLTREDVAGPLAGKEKPDLAALDRITRAFLPRVARLLGVEARTLRLNTASSGSPADHLWFVDYDVEIDGLRVESARVVFRINHGNLVQFGSENLPAPQTRAPKPSVTREQALASLADYIGGFVGSDTFEESGTLRLLPVAETEHVPGQGFAFGRGRGLLPVWQFTFRRDGEVATWRARVDAVTGEVVELVDVNHYAQVSGGVTGLGIRPMPFADVPPNGFANSAGVFNWRGIVTSSLAGLFVQVQDSCGVISLTSNANGHLPFGISPATDCSTPGFGGPGNTNSARTLFYHVNRAREIGRGWLPGNAWLNATLTVNSNLTGVTCNAFGNAAALNFYRSGGNCGNFGEIEGVAVHEFGHGLDDGDGNGFADGGSSEAYGDITAALTTHNSCIGPGFQVANCNAFGEGCTACTGVRDIDWARHADSTPDTVDNFTKNRCTSHTPVGPCGRQGHCESLIASEAVWDLAARDLPGAGTAAAWAVVDRLWYLSRPTATAAFTCNTAGATWTSNGCNIGSLWRTMRAVDDDDGNLANGTPNSAGLFAALNRHGIACAADAAANVSFRGCAQPAVPNLTVTAGHNQATLSWSGSTGVYDVYRNERGCNFGFAKVANDHFGSSFTDPNVANGTTYFYQLIAQPSGNEACASAPSTCRAVTLPNPSYEGYHDIGTCREMYGWAWNGQLPNTPISVDIYRNDNYHTTVPANLFRQDLVNAGKGNGVHAFHYVPNSAFRTGTWQSVRVRFAGEATSLGSTPRSIICGVTCLTSQVPTENVSTGGVAYMVANRFRSTHAGMITHLRFYRAAGESGTNTGRLWTEGGVQLAQANFPATPTSGWVEVALPTPVAISANTLYRVGVNTNFQQAKTGCGLDPDIVNQNLTADLGFWLAGNGVFPTTTSCSNFFVDVRFDI